MPGTGKLVLIVITLEIVERVKLTTAIATGVRRVVVAHAWIMQPKTPLALLLTRVLAIYTAIAVNVSTLTTAAGVSRTTRASTMVETVQLETALTPTARARSTKTVTIVEMLLSANGAMELEDLAVAFLWEHPLAPLLTTATRTALGVPLAVNAATEMVVCGARIAVVLAWMRASITAA